MDEETDILDWGNEDDEHQEAPSQFVDDEDAVSLGDDEDEQDYYRYQPQQINGDAVAGQNHGTKIEQAASYSHREYEPRTSSTWQKPTALESPLRMAQPSV